MSLVNPHGREKILKPLLLSGQALQNEQERAKSMARVTLSSRETGDLIMLGIGGFTPLSGFMGYEDWKGSVEECKLADGTFWPIPITLSTTQEQADKLKIGEEVALVDEESGETMGSMTIEEKYAIDKSHECREVFKTDDPNHPGVLMVMNQGAITQANCPIQLLYPMSRVRSW